MKEFLKTAAEILGLLISGGTVLCVTLPSLRSFVAERLTGSQKTHAQLLEIRRLMEEQGAASAVLKREAELQRQVDVCVLRDLITTAYYQYAQEKRIPVYALENVTALYELYKKRGGNSYVESLVNQILDEWDIVS
ncbi:MAG: hypothetical protein IKD18_03195 [Clostridia bacterium]|nr:hypothetical protein [Clostridia bacterium]